VIIKAITGWGIPKLKIDQRNIIVAAKYSDDGFKRFSPSL